MGRRKNNPRLVQQMIDGIGTMNIDEFEKDYCSLNNDDKTIVDRAINMLIEADDLGYDVEFQNEEDFLDDWLDDDDEEDFLDDGLDDNDEDNFWDGPMEGGVGYYTLGEGYEGDEYWKNGERGGLEDFFIQELYERTIRAIDKVINDDGWDDDDESRKKKGSAVLVKWIKQFRANK